jgi:hypothetical protein
VVWHSSNPLPVVDVEKLASDSSSRNRAGSKLKWIDRNTYLAIRRLLDGEINFL